MQEEISKQDPFLTSGIGVLGRISDALATRDYKLNSFGVDTSLVSLAGKLGNYTKAGILSAEGISKLNAKSSDELEAFLLLNSADETQSSLFAESWSSNLVSTFDVIVIFVSLIFTSHQYIV